MTYVQQVRGKWILRITVPPELPDIIGHRELVESDLPSDAKTREKLAHACSPHPTALMLRPRGLPATRS